MNIRLKCSCGTRLSTSDELRGRMIRCPKCRKTMRVPATAQAGGTQAEDELPPGGFVTEDLGDEVPQAPPSSTWQTHATSRADDKAVQKSGWWKWALLVLVLLVPLGVVGVLVILPMFQPKDPRELVAQRYLEAIRREDWAEANRLSVQTTHPRLASVERVALDEQRVTATQGKFTGLQQFHGEISQKYTYNADRGRFSPKDELGLGLDALSAVEGIKKKAEEQAAANASDSSRKYRNPEDKLLDDVIGTYGAFGELAKNAGNLFSSGTLGPTYEDLLKKTQVPLSDAERSLAQHFMRDPAKWQRLLGRPFLDLPDLGEFELHEVQIQAIIRTEGQSLGEPGRPIKLRLVRFTMGSIDTGWRVWLAE